MRCRSWGAASVVLAACGGGATTEPLSTARDGGHHAAASDASGAPDGHSTHEAAPDASSPPVDAGGRWSPVCPEDAPAMGAACSLQDIDCEFGCGNVLVCVDGTWGGAVGFGTPVCGDAGPNPSACPASLSEITPGASCTLGGAGGSNCKYATGACACAFPDDPIPDAGSTWSCFPEHGCPWPSPRIGSACAAPKLQCDYEVCGDSVICTGGIWQSTVGDCGG